MQFQYKPDTKVSPRAKLMGRMKLGMFFALPEEDFNEYIKKVEEDKIFQALLSKYRIVRYRRFPGIKKTSSSFEFKEELIAANNFDLEDLFKEDPQTWQIVRKVALRMGQEKFSRFLRGDDSISFNRISKDYGLSYEESEKFKNFIDDFQLQQSFFSSDTPTSSLLSRTRLFRIAYIENQNGKLFIVPVDDSIYLARGRYVIDYKKWERLIQDKEIPPDDIKKISSIFRKLDMINRRTSTLYQILCEIKEKQRRFLLTANPKNMTPLTQYDLAKSIGVHPSTISRAIANKSIITPWGREKALKDFFPGEKKKIKILLLELIKDEAKELKEGTLPHPLSDEKIKEELKELFGVKVARRTVTKYRKELMIPSSKRRKAWHKLAWKLRQPESAKELEDIVEG